MPQGEGGLTMPTEGGGGPETRAEPSTSGPDVIDDECGPVDPPPATLTHDGGDWVLTIPAGSALHDRHVDIGTDASGALIGAVRRQDGRVLLRGHDDGRPVGAD